MVDLPSMLWQTQAKPQPRTDMSAQDWIDFFDPAIDIWQQILDFIFKA